VAAKRKRANGAGSYYREGDGWVARVTDPSTGRRVKRRATSEKGAKAALADLLVKLDRGTLVGNTSITLGDHIEDWLATEVWPKLRPSSAESYQTRMRAHVIPTLGQTRLVGLTPKHLRKLYAGQLADGLSPTTVHGIHVVLSRALLQAEREELIRRSPARLVQPPSVPDYEGRPFATAAEAVKFMMSVRDHRHGPLWWLLLGTGVRFGEAAALRWQDVDLDDRRARIIYTLSRPRVEEGKRSWAFTPTKTRRSRRDIPLPRFVVAALRRQRLATVERRLKSTAWEEHDLVFTDLNGGPVRANHVLVAWHRALDAAGLERRRMHDARHTYATLLLEDGAELRSIGDQLGHATLAVTSDVYAAPRMAPLRRLADRIDELLDVPEDAASG
jgi:integrase